MLKIIKIRCPLLNRSVLWTTILCLLGFGLAANFYRLRSQPDIGPINGSNLIVICIDALRADHLGCYGYRRNTSPRIDALARSGIVFERALANSSYTRESVSLLFSGLLPSMGGSAGWLAKPNPNVKGMGDLFEAAGYCTALFSSSIQLNPDAFAKRFQQSKNIGVTWGTSRNGPKLAEIAGDFIARNRSRKFMMYLHFLDPHGPYDPPEEFYARFAEADCFNPLELYRNVRMNVESLLQNGFGPGDPQFEDLVVRYDAEIAHTDFAVGMILDTLKKQGVLDNTLIVITADHGEEFLEHRFVEHAWTLYNESIHVPLVLWSKQIRQPRRIAAPVSHVDILPTLLALLRIPSSRHDFDGEVLFSRKGDSFSFSPPQKPHISELLIQHRNILRAVIKDNWKYIAAVKWARPQDRPGLLKIDTEKYEENRSLHVDSWGPPVREELFDLSSDPAELTNIAETHAAKCEELKKILEHYKGDCIKRGANRSHGNAREKPLSADDKKKLKSLGYL